jgi:hypothetical protein
MPEATDEDDHLAAGPDFGASPFSPDHAALAELMATWGNGWEIRHELGMWFGTGRTENPDGSYTLTGPALAASSPDALDRELAVSEAYG